MNFMDTGAVKGTLTFGNKLHSTHILYVQRNLYSDCEFLENWRSDSNTLLITTRISSQPNHTYLYIPLDVKA